MESHLGQTLPLWSVLPFVGLLLGIALLPLARPHFWEKHFGKVSLAFGAPVGIYILLADYHEVVHTGLEYFSFIVLLAALFTISGGILLQGTLRGRPSVNCAFLAVGAVIANILGTTGASMLLIRPLLRANAQRKKKSHVIIFFIFIVANVGGVLTPIGDPPLFMGYLKGVPFFWTVKHLWHFWILAVSLIIGVFFFLDRHALLSEERENPRVEEPVGERVPLSLAGTWNFLLLGAVIVAVFFPTPWREIVMLAATAISARKTPKWIHEKNEFTYFPIEEVAILFAGIFAAMIPALLILKARGAELGVSEPWHFFWATGSLSSFLDNTPTYLTFFSLAQGLPGPADIVGMSARILQALSAGAVFMGANSYIGNAPNFMVKSIAEASGVQMPSFLGYMAYSVVVLVPIFVLVTWVFLE
ncbi:MAG: sodium:proton antiporter [Thermodesulfobacteriota bacterium]|nr:sodium:proton antiporter [Thermodesulfobacteriota bacterium]